MKKFVADKLLQIAMPMGGIGAGCVCLAGNGALVDWSIRNHANTTALADGWDIRESAFALIRIGGAQPVTRLLEGPLPPEKIYDQGLQSGGYRHGFSEGLPRFASSEFRGAYPFGEVKLADPAIPLEVTITGFNPFIPLDDKNSGLPCAILEYRFHNPTNRPVEFQFSYHLCSLARSHEGDKNTRNEKLPGFGIHFTNRDKPNSETFGSSALGVIGHDPRIKAMWFRGGWFDYIAALWREVSTGTFRENDPGPEASFSGTNGGSVMLPATLAAGESITFPIVIAWYFPNVHLKVGGLEPDSVPGLGSTPPPPAPYDDKAPAWRPYYAGVWKDAADVAQYARKNYESLRSRSKAFSDALFGSTLPDVVIDAVASNLAIIKSPTVLRQENGSLWCWEGSFPTHGSCHGSCTHVWNYAQAFPHLFPQLERTLREQELIHSMDERGHVTFRTALPIGPSKHDFHAAADGQLGGILKVFRDWQICGDRAWLERMYPLAKRSLDYCIGTWDPDEKGELAEPHHNTYDIEFWGPDGMCMSIYVGALAAMSSMAGEMDASEDAQRYSTLAKSAAVYLDEHLFNGEYFNQKIEYRSLRDKSFLNSIEKPAADANPEVIELLRAEGPKYQYGNGCISDGVIGAWMAELYGVQSPQNAANIRKALASIYRYNFKSDLSQHACTQRPGYAIGHEGGLILCTWPHGDMPTLPFVYSDEVWTGIEYQVASHLIMNGMVDEGLAIVKAARDRYEGHVRNPFNEYECGSYYARALASYALLQACSGFRYSAVTQTLWFGPKIQGRPFRTFFSTASGFGTIELASEKLTIMMIEGKLAVKQLRLLSGEREQIISVSASANPAQPLVVGLGRRPA
jgi:uncharacterized protein (DUF608 family)